MFASRAPGLFSSSRVFCIFAAFLSLAGFGQDGELLSSDWMVKDGTFCNAEK